LTGELPLGGGGAVGRGAVAGRAEVFVPGQAQPYAIDPLLPVPPEVAGLLNRLVEEFRTLPLASEGP
jgi:hypothetical protein